MFRYAIAGLLMLSGALAMADGLSYDRVQASFEEIDIDVGGGFEVDGDGFSLGGSMAVGDNWYILGEYTTADFDLGVDYDELSLGGGYHHGLSDRTDFIAELTYENAEADSGAVSVDDSGLGLAVGLRSMVNPKLELEGKLSYVDLDDSGDDTSIGFRAWYAVSSSFAVGVGAEFGDDVSGYGIGARWYFDR